MAGLLWYRSYMNSLANTNGYYPDIHAGHADRVTQLTLETPYLVRETPAGYNQLELMELVGGTVAWNQLCNSSSVTGTSGHKFYLKKSGAESITNTDTFTGLSNGTDMVIDLTLMLGSTLADYVYSLEQSQAGSGIAWLKRYNLIDDQYHAYNAGSLESVNVSAHIMRGRNLLPKMVDGTYEGNGVKAVVSNGVATLSGTTTTSGNALIIPLTEEVTVPTEQCYLHFMNSDAQGNVAPSFELSTDVGNTNVSFSFSPANRIVAVNQNRLGVTWDRIRFYLGSGVTLSGTFSPMLCYSNEAMDYAEPWSETYPIDSSVTLRGMLKKDASNNLYYDGDEYLPDGTVKRYWGERAYQSGDASDGSTMITDGTDTVYKLGSPTTESADPYTAMQDVEEGGTEEFVTGNNVPVGNVSVYRRA